MQEIQQTRVCTTHWHSMWRRLFNCLVQSGHVHLVIVALITFNLSVLGIPKLTLAGRIPLAQNQVNQTNSPPIIDDHQERDVNSYSKAIQQELFRFISDKISNIAPQEEGKEQASVPVHMSIPLKLHTAIQLGLETTEKTSHSESKDMPIKHKTSILDAILISPYRQEDPHTNQLSKALINLLKLQDTIPEPESNEPTQEILSRSTKLWQDIVKAPHQPIRAEQNPLKDALIEAFNIQVPETLPTPPTLDNSVDKTTYNTPSLQYMLEKNLPIKPPKAEKYSGGIDKLQDLYHSAMQP